MQAVYEQPVTDYEQPVTDYEQPEESAYVANR